MGKKSYQLGSGKEQPLMAGNLTMDEKKYGNRSEEKDYFYSFLRSDFRPVVLRNSDDMKGILK